MALPAAAEEQAEERFGAVAVGPAAELEPELV